MLRPHGYAIGISPDLPAPIEFDLVQCAHCNRQCRVKKREPEEGGWCTLCNQFICSKGPNNCVDRGVCANWIKQIELREAGNFARLRELKVLELHLSAEQLLLARELSDSQINDVLRLDFEQKRHKQIEIEGRKIFEV